MTKLDTWKRLACLIFALLAIGCSKQYTEIQKAFYEAQTHVLKGDVDWVVKAVRANPALKSQRDSWDQSTLLHAACANVQKQSMVEMLLQLGFDPNARDDQGQTPLHYAAVYEAKKAIADALIQAGADPTLKDKKGKLPSDYSTTSR